MNPEPERLGPGPAVPAPGTPAAAPEAPPPASHLHPRHIDDFAIEGVLGQGASGIVYLARQSRPARRVALKVQRGQLLSEDSLFRFEREAALMGSIEHPNIARLYGTGHYREAGFDYPYLVMERVEGLPLTEHANHRRLDLCARVRLLATLAHAAHFVHSRGVIHRDLKPANILVDQDGVPKVLDFGVARATLRDEAQVYTQVGQLIGTLPYMAPEQLLGDTLQIDLQVDVYALGMIGFELLGGRLPYPAEAFRTVITAAQTLRLQPPELEAAKLALPRDLRRVLAKAVHGDRAVRYGSALALALDLDRYLAHEPVLAQPPGLVHGLALFVRRRRALAGALAISLASLVAAVALSTHFALAERTAYLREQQARARADSRADDLAATNSFLEEILTGSDPGNGQGAATTVHELLDRARQRLHTHPPDNPAVAIRAGMAVGDTLVNLHDSAAGMATLAEAAARARATPGLDPHLRNEMLYDEAATLVTYDFSGRAEQRLRELLPLSFGTTDEDHTLWIDVRLSLAQALMQAGRPVDATPFMEAVEAAGERWHDPQDLGQQYVRMSRLTLDYFLGHYDALIAQQAREDGALGAAGSAAQVIRENLARVAALSARDQNRPELAIRLRKAQIAQATALYGSRSQTVLEGQSDLAYLLLLRHPHDRAALAELARTRQQLQAEALPEPMVLADARINEAAGLLLQDNAAQARLGERTLFDIQAQAADGRLPANSTVFRAGLLLAQHLATQGRPQDALAIYTPLCHTMDRQLNPGNPFRLRCAAGLRGDRVNARQT